MENWSQRDASRLADPLDGLPRAHYGAILVDLPWRYENWSKGDLALPNTALCLWTPCCHS